MIKFHYDSQKNKVSELFENKVLENRRRKIKMQKLPWQES